MKIRDVKLEDAERLLEIYSYYITDTAITFEYDIPSLDEFTDRIKNISSKYPYIVLEDDGKIYGYSYAGTFKARAAYDKSCELTIYLDKDAQKRGYGKALYKALEKKLFDMGIENLYACIGDPVVEDKFLTKNSEQFHAHLGFTKVGSFFKCGYKFGNWYNMIWMEKCIGKHNLKTQIDNLWRDGEYPYPVDSEYMPDLISYIHDDGLKHACMIVVPGGEYDTLSITEAELTANKFYKLGYNAFVLEYTTKSLIGAPLMDQPMKDISRAIRLIRKDADKYGIFSGKVAICGFSAGAHLCGSLSVHYNDIIDSDKTLNNISNRPDAVILGNPVIISGDLTHRATISALIGDVSHEDKLEYFSLEKHVNKNTPPTFLWYANTDDMISVENTYLYDRALSRDGVRHEMHIFSYPNHRVGLGNDRINSENNLWMELADSFVKSVM